MVESIMLIDGRAGHLKQNVTSQSLGNAKQVAIGSLGESCVILHVAANTTADVQRAAADLAQVKDVTGVTIAAIRNA